MQNNTDDSNYRYYAFISYSHKDAKWGKWLQDKIEHYRLPTVLRNEYSKDGKELPKFVRPLFRDTTDITPKGGLSMTLRQELEQSKYLIVICSPSSAKPNDDGRHWVNDEVIEFQKMGRGDKIIPLIVEGNPENNDPNIQCYPPALRDLEDKPLGISVHEDSDPNLSLRKIFRPLGLDVSTNNAILKILAVLLGLRYDDLKRRHEGRVKKNRLVVAFGLLLFLGLGLWYYDANYREKIYYYADYVERYGVPEGRFPLEQAQTQKRNRHYRLIYVGGKITELRFVNSANTLQNHEFPFEERPSRALFTDYDENGRPKSVQYFNKSGEEKLHQTWSNNRKAVYFESSKANNNNEFYLSADIGQILSSLIKTKSAITSYVYEYDEDGFAKKQYFMGSNLSTDQAKDATNIYGYILERNEHSIIVQKTFMNKDGTPMSIKNGTNMIFLQFNNDTSLKSISYFDSKKNLITQEKGFAKISYKYDERKNKIEEEYFNMYDKAMVINEGYAKTLYKYNELDYQVEISFLGVDNKPISNKHGIAKAIIKVDKNGNIEEIMNFDINNQLGKFAKIIMKNNEYGIPTEMEYFDAEHKSILKISLKANEFGNPKNIRVFNKNDKQILKLDFKYDIRKNINEILTLDSDAKLFISPSGEPPKTVLRYNEQGNISEVFFLGVHEEPFLNKIGFSRLIVEYDELGNVKEETYFGLENGFLYRVRGLVKLVRKFDYKKNIKETTYFGVDNKAFFYEGVYAKLIQEYDGLGNLIKEAYYGPEPYNEAVLYKGFAKMTQKFDERGNLTEQACFDSNNNLVIGDWGYAKLINEFDKYGNRLKQSYFGANSEPILYNGYAELRNKYDNNANIIEEAYFGVDGNPILHKNGYAKITLKYDELGNVASTIKYDKDGTIIP